MKLPDEPKEGFPILEWGRKLITYLRATRITSVIGGRLRESASGTTLEIIFPKERRTSPTKPPLWVTLRAVPASTAGDPPTWEVLAEYGHVIPHHNASSETGAPIEITSLPTPDAPLAVIEDDKLWVELTIDVEGKCTAAAFDSGTIWPDDAPPELVGGNDQSGTAGQRYIRIAEIIADPESTATTPPLIREQLHTGHIDYAQPTLSENTTTSPSTSEARVMKEWNSSAGRFDFRFLKAICGIKITENTDDIEIKPDGDSFRVKLWHTTISGGYSAGGGGGPIVVDQGESPYQEFWVLNGVWYLDEPADWSECGGSSEPVFDVSWVIPTIGGSE